MEHFATKLLMVILFTTIEVISFGTTIALPSKDGFWYGGSEYGNSGKYIPGDEGKYIHLKNPYNHMDIPYVPHKEPIHTTKYVFVPGHYKNDGDKIIKQVHHYNKNKYDFMFETENKIRAEEKATVVTDKKKGGTTSQGFYEYIGDDGFLYRVRYIAGKYGFVPSWERLPTPHSGRYVKVSE